MDKTIVVGGKTYKLVPVEEPLVEVYGGIAQQEEQRPVEAKITGSSPVAPAVPKVSDYRERYKRHEIRPNEVTAKPSYPTRLLKKHKGENLGRGDFFGEGLEMDI